MPGNSTTAFPQRPNRIWVPQEPWANQEREHHPPLRKVGLDFAAMLQRQRDYGLIGVQQEVEKIRRYVPVLADHFTDKTLDITNQWLSTSAGGSSTIIDSRQGGWVRLRATAGGPGQTIRLDTNNIRHFKAAQNPILQCRVKLVQAANFIFRVGFYNASLTQDFIWFEHSETAGGTANWFGECDAAATTTSTTTGVAGDTTTPQLLEIRVATTGVLFVIDNDVKLAIDANIPTLDLQPIMQVTTIGAGGSGDKDVEVDYIEITQDPV